MVIGNAPVATGEVGQLIFPHAVIEEKSMREHDRFIGRSGLLVVEVGIPELDKRHSRLKGG
jgi:hypothetical protein